MATQIFKNNSSVRGKKTIYIDETWLDNDITVNKCWQNEQVFGVTSNMRSSGRLIVVHVGSVTGFVPNADVIFKAGCATGDYHGQMNEENFKHWMENLLNNPNIPLGSVIVFDNAPYHSVVENKPSTKYSLKAQMIAWLEMNNIAFDEKMLKCELMTLVNENKPPEKTFKIDTFI